MKINESVYKPMRLCYSPVDKVQLIKNTTGVLTK